MLVTQAKSQRGSDLNLSYRLDNGPRMRSFFSSDEVIDAPFCEGDEKSDPATDFALGDSPLAWLF